MGWSELKIGRAANNHTGNGGKAEPANHVIPEWILCISTQVVKQCITCNAAYSSGIFALYFMRPVWGHSNPDLHHKVPILANKSTYLLIMDPYIAAVFSYQYHYLPESNPFRRTSILDTHLRRGSAYTCHIVISVSQVSGNDITLTVVLWWYHATALQGSHQDFEGGVIFSKMPDFRGHFQRFFLCSGFHCHFNRFPPDPPCLRICFNKMHCESGRGPGGMEVMRQRISSWTLKAYGHITEVGLHSRHPWN
jgi:hypothetical protein